MKSRISKIDTEHLIQYNNLEHKGGTFYMSTSQLLIIGNGFDLHCGLKSAYKDFFNNAILDTSVINFGTKQLKAKVSGFWESLLLEYYKKWGDLNYNWCDIETIIKNTLLIIGGKNKRFAFKELRSVKLCEDWYKAINNVNDPIEKFIYTSCKSILQDIFVTKPDRSGDTAYSLLINHILHELHKFESRFCKYIKDNIINPNNKNAFNEKYIVNAMNLLMALTGFTNTKYESIDDIIDRQEEEYMEQLTPGMYQSAWRDKNVLSQEFDNLHSINILSFNYTALFDVLKVKSPCFYNNVHGKLCLNECTENCSSCNIIFGIDDKIIQSQDENFELNKFSKTYRKMLNSNEQTNILPAKDNQFVEIKFYGHSLSEADYSYFQSIFDYYNIYENSKISLIFYYSKGFEQTEEVYRLINTYGKTLANKDQGKNLTHKLLLENRLKIVEID